MARLVLLCSPALLALFTALVVQGGPNPKDKCFDLFKAINDFLVFDANEKDGKTAQKFTEITGVNVAEDNAVWEFACKLADVETIGDLAVLLPKYTYKEVKTNYIEHVSGVRKTGGVEATQNHLHMRVRIIALALEYNLTGVDFTKFPLRVSKVALLNFFGTLSSEFGSNFLDWVYHAGEFRDMEKVFVLDDLDAFVDGLRESRDFREFAKKMKFHPFRTFSMLKALTQFAHEKHGTYVSYIKLVQQLQAYGLYDLRE